MIHLAWFLIGIYLTIRCLAACYRIIDLSYRLGSDWPGILARIIFWGSALGLALWLSGTDRAALYYGVGTYLLIHILAYPLGRLFVYKITEAVRQQKPLDNPRDFPD